MTFESAQATHLLLYSWAVPPIFVPQTGKYSLVQIGLRLVQTTEFGTGVTDGPSYWASPGQGPPGIYEATSSFEQAVQSLG